ncbi:PVC-type heme-binding CxxCH protein [Thalassoglobus sp. JC818]|uniref:PVC-type heme-binding CxxCH protein n=1 Tax=Thalassoglobus sp. JC818 TaxID=3232136 RepID=UPI00345B1CC8
MNFLNRPLEYTIENRRLNKALAIDMNRPSYPVIWTCLFLVIIASADAVSAQDASGIRTANLKGADIELMNNHDPASQLETFDLLPDYQVNLFAADPMFANPVHMHWDSHGRLWVACSWAYPQLKPGEVANDKIIILEDTDDDGVADKSTVFADGLYLPTGIELANGGCYVAQSPDVFFLKDTDGDDVADVKELVLTGFGIEDSHHSISAWRRGPGGWIYFQEGIFLHAQVETQYGVLRNFNGGVYQFNPRTRELKMFCRGTGGNPWGHVFDRWGQSFMVNNPRIMYLSPATGNSEDAVRVQPLISTEKQCGGDLATGSHVGDDIRGQLLTGRFKSRTVVRYQLIEDGAGFSANVLEPLISSRHPNFRPVDVKIGPDGAIYVADWYNSIINHAQHDFRDPRRDHDHGRIWRITHKERPLVAKPKLVGIPVEELIENLKSEETWTRHQARKELSECDADEVLIGLEQWVESLEEDDPNYDHHLVEAMWACQNVERVSEDILKRVLAAKDGNARSAGVRVIRYWHKDLSDPVGMIAVAAGDPFPRTRMEAVLSAGFIPRAAAFLAALNSLDHPGDPVLDLALPQTMAALEPYWRPLLDSGKLRFAKSTHREFVERSTGLGFQKRLSEFLNSEAPSDQETASIQAQLLSAGSEDDIRTIVSALTRNGGLKSDAATIAMLETLEQMSTREASKSLRREFRGLRELINNENEVIAIRAAEALGSWGMAGRDELSLLENDAVSLDVKQAIAVALAVTSKQRYEKPLLELAERGDIETRYVAAAGLAQADLSQGVAAAANLLQEDPQQVDAAKLVKFILLRKNGDQLLSEKLQDVAIHPAVLASVSNFHRETGLLSNELVDIFAPVKPEESLAALLLAEDIDALAAEAEKHGDPANGELIYRRKSTACTRCHAIGPAGAEIGPNLVAVGAAAKTKYLVQSILEPNSAIAEHYEARSFLLTSGKVLTGVVTFRNEDEVIVRDSSESGKEIRISTEEIEDEVPSSSLMPGGLADQLHGRQEFLDLVRFLSELGKPGPYANNEKPVIRKWKVVSASEYDDLPEDGSEWLTAFSKVDGELPPEDFPAGNKTFLRSYVNVLVPGKAQLKLNSSDGLKLWIDGAPIDDLLAPIQLDKGHRTLTFTIDRTIRDSGLRVELDALNGEGVFQPEGGFK